MMRASRLFALASSIGLSLASTAARADQSPVAEAPAPPSMAVAAPADLPRPGPADLPPPAAQSNRPEITLGVGVRASVFPSAGFDPYATTDAMAQGSFLAQITLLRFGPASILLFAEWGLGTRNAQARGQDASLTLHRLAGGAETRIALARRFYLDAKLAPMAYHLRGTIADSGLDRPLVSRAWTWGLDVSAGAGFLLGKTGKAEARGVSFWLTADLGYTFAGEAAMSYAPAPSDEDSRTHGSVSLPPFKPAGATGRFGLSIGF